MHKVHTAKLSGLWGRVGFGFLQATVLAMLLMFALPARAGDDRAVKSRVAPIYPEIAKRMKISGEVKLEATVDADGKVKDVKEVSGNHILAIAAEDAVRKWKFETGDGDASVIVAVNFALGQ
jgi:TonB family protein